LKKTWSLNFRATMTCLQTTSTSTTRLKSSTTSDINRLIVFARFPHLCTAQSSVF
jgi:hypothetical protein